jgi:nitrous oxidase accessory protein NosD
MAFAALASAAEARESLLVAPSDSLAKVSQQLADDAELREVVLAAGTYRESLVVPPLRGIPESDSARHPLLIRPAEGARVVFDGAISLGRARPQKERPGVFWSDHLRAEGEPPRLWQLDARVRYVLAADLEAVEHFPATYLLSEGKIYLHTSDGLPPGDRAILMGSLDYGISIRRRHVTVRDLEFRNFTARGKWSAAIEMRADHATVERCVVINASFGFTALGDHAALVECTARDVGGGVYLSGKEGRVEACRFFKERDDFMVPTYPQDDTAIQFYYPAVGGTVRGNLSVGFGIGILIKAAAAPHVVERNTLVGDGMKIGFVATEWHPDDIFRRNIVAGYEIPVQILRFTGRRGLERNCYWSSRIPGKDAIEAGSVVGDPRFVDAPAEDYRLDAASACLGAVEDGAIGALPLAAQETPSERRPREWHVSPSGRDGAGGSADAPIRTIQRAVDRAVPGDTILLHPGIYSEPVKITAGGSEARPLTIRAVEKGTVILDGGRRVDVMIAVEEAPFVAIRDLEIRWYRSAGIRIRASSNVTVSGCRIWNAPWGSGTWPDGDAVLVESSPRFTGDRNVLFRQERGFHLISSPRATITNNTAVANLYGGAVFIRSIEDSVFMSNSFAFQGNDALVIVEASSGKERLASFDCDYNNYGMTLREGTAGVEVERLVPRPADRHLLTESKGIVYYEEEPGELHRFVTLPNWRDFSSKDIHSIFADPLYVSTASRDFRLEPGSPNVGAGPEGTTIGALGTP